MRTSTKSVCEFIRVLVSLLVTVEREWLDGFYRGLLRLAKREKTPLAGGDLARAKQTTCDIVVCGASRFYAGVPACLLGDRGA